MSGATVFLIWSIWVSWITTVFLAGVFPEFKTLSAGFGAFLLLFFVLWVFITILFAVGKRYQTLFDKFYEVYGLRLQFELRKSAIIIISLQVSRIIISVILLILSLFYPLNFVIFLLFVILIEGIDCFFDSLLHSNFPRHYRERFYNLDDYTDWITRIIFYLPYYLLIPHLWILFFLLLDLLMISITYVKYNYRWIKIFAVDPNFALIFYFFFPPLFPFVLFGSFAWYLAIYIHYLFRDYFLPKGEPRSVYAEFLDTFEDIEKSRKDN
jgi:hypothetical protein